MKPAVRKTSPRGCCKNLLFSLGRETQKLYDEEWKPFESKAFNKTASDLREKLADHDASRQREEWTEFIEYTNFSRDSQEAWKKLRLEKDWTTTELQAKKPFRSHQNNLLTNYCRAVKRNHQTQERKRVHRWELVPLSPNLSDKFKGPWG